MPNLLEERRINGSWSARRRIDKHFMFFCLPCPFQSQSLVLKQCLWGGKQLEGGAQTEVVSILPRSNFYQSWEDIIKNLSAIDRIR